MTSRKIGANEKCRGGVWWRNEEGGDAGSEVGRGRRYFCSIFRPGKGGFVSYEASKRVV